MKKIVTDIINTMAGIAEAIQFEVSCAIDRKKFKKQAKEILVPIEKDFRYVAQLLRRYNQVQNYFFKKLSPEELPFTEEEATKFIEAESRIKDRIANSKINPGCIIALERIVKDNYFLEYKYTH